MLYIVNKQGEFAIGIILTYFRGIIQADLVTIVTDDVLLLVFMIFWQTNSIVIW